MRWIMNEKKKFFQQASILKAHRVVLDWLINLGQAATLYHVRVLGDRLLAMIAHSAVQ